MKPHFLSPQLLITHEKHFFSSPRRWFWQKQKKRRPQKSFAAGRGRRRRGTSYQINFNGCWSLRPSSTVFWFTRFRFSVSEIGSLSHSVSVSMSLSCWNFEPEEGRFGWMQIAREIRDEIKVWGLCCYFDRFEFQCPKRRNGDSRWLGLIQYLELLGLLSSGLVWNSTEIAAKVRHQSNESGSSKFSSSMRKFWSEKTFET